MPSALLWQLVLVLVLVTMFIAGLPPISTSTVRPAVLILRGKGRGKGMGRGESMGVGVGKVEGKVKDRGGSSGRDMG